MNFSTECLEHLMLFKLTTKLGNMPLDEVVIDSITHDLKQAIKFILPPPNLLNVKVTAPAMKLLRLPYPMCAFEYSCPMARAEPINGLQGVKTGKSSKRIALAYDCSKDVGPIPMLKATGQLNKDSNGILVISLYYMDDIKMWACSFAAGYIDEEITSEISKDMLIDNMHIRTRIEAKILMTEFAYNAYSHLDSEQRHMALINDVSDEVAMATRACLMLNTKNLRIIKVNEAPEKLNKKREKKNKPPFFEYHTLDIFVSKTGKRIDRKRVDYRNIQREINSINLDRKWGMVMGHFKVRSTGVFWWNEHGRGNPTKGIIKKDYRVKLES